MNRQLLVLAALAGSALAACSQGRAETSGATAERRFEVGAFTGLEVAGPFDVTVSTGRPVAVAASGSKELIDSMEVVVEGGVLKIRPQRSGLMGGFRWRGGPAKVTVSVPMLDRADIAGSGDLSVDRVAGDRFEGGIAGSGEIKLGEVRVRDLRLGIAGSGGVSVRGQADSAAYEVAGSGSVDAVNLTATRATMEIAGSGDIRARVTGEARAEIAGSGDIEISGGARCSTSKHGSGNIRCS
jgi:hypothetical protein